MSARTLARAAAGVFIVATAAALLGIGVRATYGAHVAVDEPQYLLTALSLAEDHDLDISDEIAERRYLAWSEADPPVQTAVLKDGRRVSPHDPLLPALLALPVGAGGWVAAKATLAVLSGGLAALVLWVAVRRLAVPVPLATAGVAVAFASPPLAVYGQQVYPELPAALAAVLAVAALTGPLGRAGLALLAGAVIALPWLSVKYTVVAMALGAVAVYRLGRARRHRALGGLGAGLAVAGVVYAAAHRLVWGGWTVYASGDHFQRFGELGVVGFAPDYVGRSLRLVGLLVDRGFGIASWQPAWLLVLPAVAALAGLRSRGGAALAWPLAAGWAVATWVAVTMHGYWWPGRQVVVVLPLALLAILVWLARTPRRFQLAALALGLAGVGAYGCLLLDGYAREITWVVGFEDVHDPLYQTFRLILPDYRHGEGPALWVRHAAWIAALLALALLGLRSPAPDPPRHPPQRKGPHPWPSAHEPTAREPTASDAAPRSSQPSPHSAASGSPDAPTTEPAPATAAPRQDQDPAQDPARAPARSTDPPVRLPGTLRGPARTHRGATR